MALDGDGGGGGGGILGSGNQFTGIANAFEYIRGFVYGYGGVVPVPNVETTLFEATSSNNKMFMAQVQLSYGDPEGDNMTYKIKLNDIIVIQASISGAVDAGLNLLTYNLVIPSFTKVTVTAQNTTSVTERNQTCAITGTVF